MSNPADRSFSSGQSLSSDHSHSLIEETEQRVKREARREKYLKILGVTQYRRRTLTVLNAADAISSTSHNSAAGEIIAERPLVDHEAAMDQAKQLDSQKRSALFDRTPTSEKIPNLPIDTQVDKVLDRIHDQSIDHKAGSLLATPRASRSESKIENQANPDFDLLIWRANRLLVLDFSRHETESTAIKHQLTNNILKALWPGEFSGCDMYQYSWPITGIRPDADSGREWFNSLVSGYTEQGTNTPIWLMGEPGLKLLFPRDETALEDEEKPQDAPLKSIYEDLIGSRTRHPTMEIDFLIGPGLSTLLESSVAKVQTWQLLKALRSQA